MFGLGRLFGRSDNNRHLATVIETAVDGVILIDGTGRILIFNPACERLFGYSAGEVIGRNVRMLMPEPYRNHHDSYLKRYLRTGEAGIIGIGRVVTGLRKDGTTFPMDLSVGESEELGRPIFVGMIRDLTERRQLERAEAASAARLRAVIDTAVDGVILADSTGTILMVNPAVRKLFGYGSDEVLGRNVSVLMPPRYAAQHDQYLRNYHETGRRKIIGIGREVTGQRKDGTTFPMDLSVGEALQDGEKVFVGIVHDLTERKRSESQLAQAQKMEAVGQIAGGISHDFNNLLTVIMGNVDILAEMHRADEDAVDLLQSVALAAERGSSLTRRLLAFSRRQILQPARIDCNRLVSELGVLMRRSLREDIEIVMSLAPNIPTSLADPAQLESAVLNLAVNAQDAMPDGGTLTIATSEVDFDEAYRGVNPEILPGHYVMIAVTDTGTGMTGEVLDRVFEPFFTTKDVGKGSGLGLPMVYGFVKQSNGHVTVYSEVGLGTTVRLYLPAADARAGIPAAPAAAPAPHPGRGEMILVVEDDDLVRSYATRCIELMGFKTVSCSDGPEALRRIAQGLVPDLLFTDIVMPGGLSGWDTAIKAREMVPDLPVLFNSGYPRDTLIRNGRLTDTTPLLDKPFRKSQLARQITEVLSRPPCELPSASGRAAPD